MDEGNLFSWKYGVVIPELNQALRTDIPEKVTSKLENGMSYLGDGREVDG